MKKIFCVLAADFMFTSAFASTSVEFGLGSGFIFYGSKTLKNTIRSFDESSQVIICANADYGITLAPQVILSAGVDSVFDARWKGSNHIYLWDYAAEVGFDFYPGLAGLLCSVDYCLGRRTDFVDLGTDEDVTSTKWGNGFAFGLAYDFGHGRLGFAPQVGAAWRHMPRGSSSDNIIQIKLKIRLD